MIKKFKWFLLIKLIEELGMSELEFIQSHCSSIAYLMSIECIENFKELKKMKIYAAFIKENR